jgi:dihydrolipoyl dehydrogenase
MADALDLAVVGSGPGGYVAAIRAAQLGMKVAVVERDELGGICTNWGCIPTKALLRSAELLELLRHGRELGVHAESIGFDFAQVIGRSRAVAAGQVRGIEYLFRKNKIEVVQGSATFAAPRRLLVDGKELPAKRVILATGARPKALPMLEHDGDRVLSYREAMNLPERPMTLAIVGAGAIGVEFAYFYSALGTSIALIEAEERILPVEDEEISKALTASFKKRGIEVLTGHRLLSADKRPSGVTLQVADATGATRPISADRVLLAAGVRGNVEGMGLAEIGVTLDRGFIAVDRATYATSVDGLFAIGDVIGPPMLAHKASAEGIACVERMAGVQNLHTVDYDHIPGATFCHPEIASVGLTEQGARDAGHEVRVGRFPWAASGRAKASGDTEGFVKVVLGRHGELLGAHVIGGNATDLIAELGLAMSGELTSDEILSTVHAHPTFAEAVKEAVAAALGEAIDL